ncbi:MAG TPA: sigma-70 family RNA polymerase sigma factor [Anaerolineae bacterium]|nr:sigma-70 family RNA polymerase sigma factor [Anaerolineae bacterium]
MNRSNEDWLLALSEQPGEAQAEALQDLRDYLLRAVLVYLSVHRSDLAGWSRLAVRHLAEDLAQDALMDIRASLSRFRGESKFTTWAYRFVINRAATELRRQRYQNISLDQLREEEPATFKAILNDREAGRVEPELLAEQRYYIALLRQIVETELSERQRLAMIGVHWQGRSLDEVAAGLGLTRNALYKLLHDARKSLRARLLARHLTEGDILSAFQE